MRAHWELDAASNSQGQDDAEVVQEQLPKTVLVCLQSKVPVGCNVTIALNGEHLQPTASRNDKFARLEKRFALAPLGSSSNDDSGALADKHVMEPEAEEPARPSQG